MKSALLFLGFIWSFPATLVAYLLGVASGSEFHQTHKGKLVVCSRGFMSKLFDKIHMGAMTIGAVVFATEAMVDADDFEEVLEHEHVHFVQWMVLGPLFPVAYYGAMLVLLLMKKDPYFDNPLEKQARKVAGR